MAYNRGDYRHKWRIEHLATAIRGKLGLDQLTPLDPWRLADVIPAHIFYPEDFDDDGLAQRVRTIKWDGFAFPCPGHPTLVIVLNPVKPETRQTAATLMEEFSHHLLRHEPSSIALNRETGFLERSYNRSQEDEAYDLGAALLLPKERIQHDVAAQRTAEQIASDHRCSDDIVLYRIKRMRLWQRYARYVAKGATEIVVKSRAAGTGTSTGTPGAENMRNGVRTIRPGQWASSARSCW